MFIPSRNSGHNQELEEATHAMDVSKEVIVDRSRTEKVRELVKIEFNYYVALNF